MSRNIPFFEMFAELQLSAELRLKLAGAELTGACIDQAAMTIRLLLTVRTALSEEDLQSVKDAIGAVYGFTSVDIDMTCKAPVGAAKSAPVQAASSDSKGGKPAVGKK